MNGFSQSLLQDAVISATTRRPPMVSHHSFLLLCWQPAFILRSLAPNSSSCPASCPPDSLPTYGRFLLLLLFLSIFLLPLITD